MAKEGRDGNLEPIRSFRSLERRGDASADRAWKQSFCLLAQVYASIFLTGGCMSLARSKWLMAGVLVVIHTTLVVAMFVGVEHERDGETVMGWMVFDVVDFPSALVVGGVDHSLWQKKLLWYSEDSYVTRLSRCCGFDHLNVGAAIQYLPVGTLQWGLVGYFLQAAYRRRKASVAAHCTSRSQPIAPLDH
jgi:hypothetical protein